MAAAPAAKVEQKEMQAVPLEPTADVVRLLEQRRGGRPFPTGKADLISSVRRKLSSLRELRMAVPALSPGARLLQQQQQQQQQLQQQQYHRATRQ